MRKIAQVSVVVMVTLIIAAALFLAIFRVKPVNAEGFVGPGIFGDDPLFYSVYDVKDGHFLTNVVEGYREISLDPFGGVYTEVGDFIYFGYKPTIGDHVRVREYFVWYRWHDEKHWGENFSLTFVNLLPAVTHPTAKVPNTTITVIVNDQNVGTFDLNTGDLVTTSPTQKSTH